MLSAGPAYSLARATFKRAQRGLFGGKHIQFGNNNPFSKKKTRRNWLPNVQSKKLYSETLDRFLDLKVTTSVLRTIDKKGGLDQYLLETRDKNLCSDKALELKSVILKQLKKNEKKVAAESAPKQETTTAPSSSA
ncbi:mitochondrial ribosomal protein l28 [Lichtheimia corymbifera JMRC:FSU:9682]|uniref:Large ribosomal subunit protein bL28m n=1 Tax=Lichtheimia corymbifera JMRC:FSU:9682 TaxID=1263082 RepID=A0A068S9D4_9FUNG|nr:mitochondrial ribosomal protein l28 [Lichtheimia corymbifera JMRC:FSU:9682]